MNPNKHQQAIINTIKQTNKYVIKNIDCHEYFTSVTFELDEGHFLLNKNFQVFIGPKGSVRWVSGDEVGSHNNRKQNRTNCHLAHFDIFGYGQKRFIFKPV